MADDILELLAKHEEKIMGLYTAYAGKFPDMAAFWNEMAKEEEWHAQVIREAAQKERGSAAPGFVSQRFRPELLRTSVTYLEKETMRAQQDVMTEINALVIAADIEKTMIERRFFEAFSAQTAELKDAMKMMIDATRAHMDRINTSLARYRNG